MIADPRPARLHGRKPCSTCPFRADLRGVFFKPETLDATIGRNLRGEQHVHRCHKEKPNADRQRLCVGFMRYIITNDIPNAAMRFGIRLHVIDPSVLGGPPILEDWDDVLENHAAAMARSDA